MSRGLQAGASSPHSSPGACAVISPQGDKETHFPGVCEEKGPAFLYSMEMLLLQGGALGKAYLQPGRVRVKPCTPAYHEPPLIS